MTARARRRPGISSLPPFRFVGGGGYFPLPRQERRFGLALYVRLISGVGRRGKVDPAPYSPISSPSMGVPIKSGKVRVRL